MNLSHQIMPKSVDYINPGDMIYFNFILAGIIQFKSHKFCMQLIPSNGDISSQCWLCYMLKYVFVLLITSI